MKINQKLILFLLAIGLLCPALAEAQTADTLTEEQTRKYEYYFLESIRLKMQQKYDAAFDMLQHCVSVMPNAASAHYELAQYYAYLKQPQKSEAALEKAVKYAPDNYWYCQGLANLYLQNEETDKAAELLRQMAERFPDKLDPLYFLLNIYNSQQEYEDMLGILNKLEARLGKNEQFSKEKFRVYREMGENKKAIAEMQSLANEFPKELRYQILLGDAYMEVSAEENTESKAYSLYQQVLKEEPDNAQAMYSLANYYNETGEDSLYEQQTEALLLNRKVEPAVRTEVLRQFIVRGEMNQRDSLSIIRFCDRVMETDPEDAGIPLIYAQYLLSKNMNEKAQPVLHQALDLDPTNAFARLVLLGEAAKREDYPALTDLCEGGIETNPDRLEFYFYLAIAYSQDERTQDVINVCRQALQHITKDSDKKIVSDFYTIIGDAYHTLGDNEKAYEAYDSALGYNPDNIGALNNYAYYLSLQRRDLDKAQDMSYRTIKAEPTNATYLDTYAWILFEQGNYAEARLYIDDAIKNGGGESEDVLEHCGDIYYMTGDVDGAVRYWQQALEKGSQSPTLPEKIKKKKYIEQKAMGDDEQ